MKFETHLMITRFACNESLEECRNNIMINGNKMLPHTPVVNGLQLPYVLQGQIWSNCFSDWYDANIAQKAESYFHWTC